MDAGDPARPAAVRIGHASFDVTADDALRFGRDSTEDGIVGLDPRDMGISGRSGAIEYHHGVWWVTNLSAKRSLFLDVGAGSSIITLGPGQRHAIATSPLGVLVRGAILTHRIDIDIPADALARRRQSELPTTGTILGDDLHLTIADRAALAAVFSPLLRSWPRRSGHPLTYQEAAELLGGAWTKTSVRKHLEKVKE